jgi:nucleotide-binding universal stress UspA family protein
MFHIRTILHPTDFSDYSDGAFRLACSLARDHGARLVVAHIAEPSTAVAGEGMMVMYSPPDLEALRNRLKQIRPEDSKISVEYRIVQGDAPTEILELAAQMKCDLIVLGTHGRTGLGRLLMGSVAEQVVRKAPCPVLTLKAAQHPEPPLEESVGTASSKDVPTTK